MRWCRHLTLLHQLLQEQLIAGQVLVVLLRRQNSSITNVTLADAGTYSVTITVVDVQVLPDQPLLLLIHCLQHQLQLIMVLYVLVRHLTFTPAVAGATYSWTGPGGFTSAIRTPSITNVTLADAGTYNVTITVGGCTSAAGTTTVVINPLPATPTASNNGPLCVGQTLNLSTPTVAGATYSWTGPGGFTSAIRTPSHN